MVARIIRGEDKICKLRVRWRSHYTYLTFVSSSAHHGQYVNLCGQKQRVAEGSPGFRYLIG